MAPTSGMVPPPAEKSNPLIKPLPLWAFIASIALGAVILVLIFLFTGSDWAAGAQYASWAAFGLGGAILIAFLVRTALGMLAQTNTHRRAQIISAVLLALLLFAVGTLGLTQQTGIHDLQARSFESQKQWQNAITEYQAAGESAPTSENIAEVYNSWGKDLISQNPPNYDMATQQFETVIQTYGQATDQVAQALKNEISAYQAWAKEAIQQQDYQTATTRYDKLLGQTFCQNDNNCKSTIAGADATAYYNWAEQKLNTQDYDNAIKIFQSLLMNPNFQGTPEIQQAHSGYAKALWGKAQQELNTTCSDALAIYQQLASGFADTPEGQQATTALKAPVQVSGHFTTTVPPASDTPLAFLSTNAPPTGTVTPDQLNAYINSSLHVPINSDGTFSFSNVQLGAYYFGFGTLTNPDGSASFLVSSSTYQIGPLCPTNAFRNINQQIPTA